MATLFRQRPRLADRQPLRVILDGLCILTTAGRIRQSGTSDVIRQAFAEFEEERSRYVAEGRSPCIGRVAAFNGERGRLHHIQMDIT
jgi:hypothetical protein